MTIRFLKPRKLGASFESWLKQEVLGLEWTAATCRYLEGVGFLEPRGVALPLLVVDMSGTTLPLVRIDSTSEEPIVLDIVAIGIFFGWPNPRSISNPDSSDKVCREVGREVY